MNFNFSFGFGNKPKSIEINEVGDVYYHMQDVMVGNKLNSFKKKYKTLIDSPAFMSPAKKVFDLASQAKINSYDSKGNFLKEDALYDVASRPNPFQTWTEFHSVVAFRAILGSAWIYAPNDRVTENDHIFVLDPTNVEISSSVLNKFAKLVLSKNTIKDLFKEKVKYTYPDGTSENIEIKKISLVSSMPIGSSGNLFESLSLVDCLMKPILNSESALDTEGVQLFLARKVAITGKENASLGSFQTMGDEEHRSLERSVMSSKVINSSKNPINVQRFIDNKNNLKIPESYTHSSLIVADIIGVDKSLLPFSTATYENQEKGAGRTIEYAVQPIMDKYVEVLEKLTNLESLKAEYTHCSFNQVFEKEKAETSSKRIDDLLKVKDLGIYTEKEFKDKLRYAIEN